MMVDVGYCIDGKHGIIRNVTQIGNHATDHLVFENNDGEQYALKKTDIEYVIPHEEETKEIHFKEPKRNITVVDYLDELSARLENVERSLNNI